MGEEKFEEKSELHYQGHLDGAEELLPGRAVRIMMIGILIVGVLMLAVIWLAYCVDKPLLSQTYACSRILAPLFEQ